MTEALSISPKNGTAKAGESKPFTANKDVTWSISPTTNASISSAGLVTLKAEANGKYTITATSKDNQEVQTATLTVS